MKASPDSRHYLKGFDEAVYLDTNTDVADAVEDGSFSSGLHHCLTHGIDETRKGVPNELLAHLGSQIDPNLIPPAHLRLRVHGEESQESFERAGKMVSYNIYSAMSAELGETAGLNILDFGCGSGRVVTNMASLAPENVYFGTDIDAEAISWCDEHIGHLSQFSTNGELPPFTYGDDFFDVVYSISVFTHLPEDMQFAWLEELKRVTRPNGYLFLTTHGDHLLNGTRIAARRLAKKGFYYSVGSGTDGLPEFYQTSFHSDDYIRERWSDYFEIVDLVKGGIMGHQDIVICRNSTDS